jgi:hypothetical protein
MRLMVGLEAEPLILLTFRLSAPSEAALNGCQVTQKIFWA